MKARARDQVGRKQKGFFKRQKLDILAKGLSGSLEPTMQTHHLGTKLGREDIELAHARIRQNMGPGESTGARGFIPSPVYVSSTGPRSRRRKRIGDAHTSSSDIAKSRILDNLDTCEPLFLRKVMDQILATPDLAGLSHKASEASTCQHQTPKQRKSVIQTRHSMKRPEVESTIGTVDVKEVTPPINVDETSSLDDISDWDTDCEYDGSVHDCGNFGEESIAANSDWSVYQEDPCSPATCNNGSSSEYEPAGVLGSMKDLLPSEQNLHVKVAKKSVFIRDDGETIYGRLFEDPDPWRRIGIILGLEKDEDIAPDDENSMFDTEYEVPSPSLEKDETRDSDDPIDEDTITRRHGVPESSCAGCTSLESSQGVVDTERDDGPRSWSDSRTRTHREGSPDLEVLAIPQLQEVNGRFLAPSISLDGFEWEESE